MKNYYLLALFCGFYMLNTYSQIPQNNDLQNAITITSLPFLDANVQTQNATDDSGLDAISCNVGVYSKVYYKFIPGTNVTLSINITNGQSNSFIIPTESNTNNPLNTSELTLVNDISCNFRENLSLDLIAGKIYIFLISNPDSETDIQFYVENNADIIDFPDENFKNALVLQTNPVIDLNDDGEIQKNEAFFTNKISILRSQNVSDLTGLEYFKNLIFLYCDSALNSINVSNNTLLEEISFSGIGVSNIDLTNNTALKKISTYFSSLTNLDVSNNILLEELLCSENKISSINLSENTALTYINISQTPLTSLDLSNNINLEDIYCPNNKLTSLDLSNNINLKEVSCNSNELTSLILDNNNKLIDLRAGRNQLNTLDISNNTNLETLHLELNNLTAIDVSKNTNLKILSLAANKLNTLDISNNLALRDIGIWYNEIYDLDVSNHMLLEHLYMHFNNNTIDLSNNTDLVTFWGSGLSSIDLSNNSKLRSIDVYNSFLSTIDISNNPLVSDISIASNEFLKQINLKNGGNTVYDQTINNYTTNSGDERSIYSSFYVKNNPLLNFICVDEINYAINKFTEIDSHTTFVDNCNNLEDSNSIIGKVLFDEDNNGCTTEDVKLNNILLNATDGTTNYGAYTNLEGSFTLNLNENTYTTALVNIPDYYTINPASLTTTFTGSNNEDMADFCLTANQTVSDVNIILLPITEARPGFDANYQLVYENVGTTVLSGTVELEFDSSFQSFVSSVPSEDNSTTNTISFNYQNLKPFEKKIIEVALNTFTPPTVNDRDILNLTASITPIMGDFTTTNNVFSLNQTVVNSFDPNDKQVLQGNKITLPETSNYLDYLIRFQNTGSASAINVLLTDLLDEKLDWQTLKPISSSHNYSVEIINNSFVKFTFNNINLPSEQVNEPESHGFIAFKIKPKTDVAVGDIITGKAKIYFDYNLPIITNIVSTEVVTTLSITKNDVGSKIDVYPNPVNNVLMIKNIDNLIINKLEIYDINGKKVAVKNSSFDKVNFRNFDTGVYFVKFFTDNGILYKKVLKK
ncbi:T9SS type A sorting domain-containing protein [Polaribacter sp. Hel1_85]|uniref:DUF7619 domain-containing protein n=1 Tax=Polaribacter sp. Hel1_85 TaxID=1250005 RepID=UPI00055D97E8|nr:T9SS type A sorting domain-containing protein [Polaribacter sp. Hel1_85]